MHIPANVKIEFFRGQLEEAQRMEKTLQLQVLAIQERLMLNQEFQVKMQNNITDILAKEYQ